MPDAAAITYNDGVGRAKVVQEAPGSLQFLSVSQFGQSTFIANLGGDIWIGSHDDIDIENGGLFQYTEDSKTWAYRTESCIAVEQGKPPAIRKISDGSAWHCKAMSPFQISLSGESQVP